jgi:anti-sigma factor ChrR (cupin superfamily)
MYFEKTHFKLPSLRADFVKAIEMWQTKQRKVTAINNQREPIFKVARSLRPVMVGSSTYSNL